MQVDSLRCGLTRTRTRTRMQVDRLEGSSAYTDAVETRDEVALAAKVLKSLIGP